MSGWIVTTNGCDYTNQGGVSAASANNLESKMETSDTVSPDSILFLTSEKKHIFVYSFFVVYNI